MKEEVLINKANRLINTGCVILVTSKYLDKTNIITLAWQTPLSHDPMLIGVSIAKTHFSNELITKSKEFVVNVPGASLVDKVHTCGTVSGREVDKFSLSEFNVQDSNKISTPGIKECIGNLECQLEEIVSVGDHDLFIGKVLYAQAQNDLFDGECWKLSPEAELIYHLGSNMYLISNKLYKA